MTSVWLLVHPDLESSGGDGYRHPGACHDGRAVHVIAAFPTPEAAQRAADMHASYTDTPTVLQVPVYDVLHAVLHAPHPELVRQLERSSEQEAKHLAQADKLTGVLMDIWHNDRDAIAAERREAIALALHLTPDKREFQP